MRVRLKDNQGFSLVEMMITIAILGILAGVAVPSLLKYQKRYVYFDYASQMEYLVKQAKIYAMERTTNVAVCRSGNNILTLQNMGTSRSATLACNASSQCTGNNPTTPCIIRTMTIKTSDNYVTLAGPGGSIDPRGIAIQTGNVCVSYDNSYTRVCISRTGMRVETGTGGCPTGGCSS